VWIKLPTYNLSGLVLPEEKTDNNVVFTAY
jgi:hypothetical protein